MERSTAASFGNDFSKLPVRQRECKRTQNRIRAIILLTSPLPLRAPFSIEDLATDVSRSPARDATDKSQD